MIAVRIWVSTGWTTNRGPSIPGSARSGAHARVEPGAARAAGGAAAPGPEGRLPGRGEPGAGGSAVGLDLSGPMLEVARQLAADAGAANAGFVQGDAQACPLRAASCDVIISSFGVMFFEDPAAALIAG